MNTDFLKGNWKEVKGRLKQKFAELSDDDLTYVEGKEEELLGKLQQKLSKEKGQLIDLIKNIENEIKEETDSKKI